MKRSLNTGAVDCLTQSVFGLLSVDEVVQFQMVTVIVIGILQKNGVRNHLIKYKEK